MALVELSFDNGKRIDARIAGHSISTDQSEQNGGTNGAPEPFQLFLASVATCAGIYAKSFCDERDLPAPHGLDMDIERGDDGRLSRLELILRVGDEFPVKYDRAVTRAMDLCAVKKQLREEIETTIRVVRRGAS
jgi:ribosomal protein S12 methylthiotransferase accessory factor